MIGLSANCVAPKELTEAIDARLESNFIDTANQRVRRRRSFIFNEMDLDGTKQPCIALFIAVNAKRCSEFDPRLAVFLGGL